MIGDLAAATAGVLDETVRVAFAAPTADQADSPARR